MPTETCEERRAGLVAFVGSLPAVPVVSPTRVELIRSTLGRVPGSGPALELSASEMVIDGSIVQARDLDARIEKFAEWAASHFAGDPPSGAASSSPPRPTAPVLYVAAGIDLDVQTLRAFLVHVPDYVELRLLVRTPAPKGGPEPRDAAAAARDLSAQILFEPDAHRRKRLADQGYASFSECDALTTALSSIADTEPKSRWPALRAALERTLPSCECRTVDASSLRLLVNAEQRAGAASLAWVPLSFLRDERCNATMPLRSIPKLVRQMEQFDEEFSAGVERDALRFGDVLDDDRLRVYFCDALPGETLASKARAHATLYFRVPGADACEGWAFDPLALGTPMGTWKRTGTRSKLAFHYWQATEEIRVFGPVDPSEPSKPTDSRKWVCDETFHLTGVDASSIQTDAGRWFFSEAACMRTRDELHGAACFLERVSG